MNDNIFSKLHLVNINLGEVCNMECKYCFQNGILQPQKICSDLGASVKVLRFLHDNLKNYQGDNRFSIRFTGGEPLIYFKKIKQIVEFLRPFVNKIHYAIVINGTLLTDEIVEFFNENNFEVGISNDGAITEQTRGLNVLDNPVLLDRICKIHNMHFVCVLSALNIDYKANIEYFKEKIKNKRETFWVSVNPVYNTGYCHNEDLFNFDLNKLKMHVEEFYNNISLDAYLDEKTSEHYLLKRYSSRFMTVYDNLEKGVDVTTKISCGADWSHINIDTEGNAYFCHNCSDKIGTIDDSLEKLFSEYEKRDIYTTINLPECIYCPAKIICSGGCPYVTYENRKKYYCQVQQILADAVINCFIRLHKELALQ